MFIICGIFVFILVADEEGDADEVVVAVVVVVVVVVVEELEDEETSLTTVGLPVLIKLLAPLLVTTFPGVVFWISLIDGCCCCCCCC